MSVSLASNALTTLNAVKDELDLLATSEHDDKLLRSINAASAYVEGFCNRKFAYAVDLVEKFAGQGTPRVWLARSPLVSITYVKYDGATLDADEYEIDDADNGVVYNKRGGWLWSPLAEPGAAYEPLPGYERKLYEVKYTGGFVTPAQETGQLARTLPYDLELVAIDLVVAKWRSRGRDPKVTSERIGPWSATYSSADLTEGARDVLAGYARVVQA